MTADCKSAGTPNGGKGISGATDEEQRKEILHLFSTFHSPFVEILESLKDEETEEEA
ncbi:hypothetical protein [Segatella copri]|uniref:hypothetical protein n=1 Tax=Segatella copri TaxID=165179 RepID=UPI001F1A3BA2|nr:hypothetical protein [Segatella copri]